MQREMIDSLRFDFVRTIFFQISNNDSLVEPSRKVQRTFPPPDIRNEALSVPNFDKGQSATTSQTESSIQTNSSISFEPIRPVQIDITKPKVRRHDRSSDIESSLVLLSPRSWETSLHFPGQNLLVLKTNSPKNIPKNVVLTPVSALCSSFPFVGIHRL